MCIKTILDLYSESEWRQVVSMEEKYGRNALHFAASSGVLESINFLLSLLPESEHIQAVYYVHSQRIQALNMKDINGGIALHHAAMSDNPKSIKAILDLYPESQQLQMFTPDRFERTILHCADYSRNSIVDILDLVPESHHLRALDMKCADGETALHVAVEAGNAESVKAILNMYPESVRLRVVCTHTESGMTALLSNCWILRVTKLEAPSWSCRISWIDS